LGHLSNGKEDADLLIGIETSDDAGVYRLNNSQAIVQTVDFFTPVVDDPYSFGQIAAANALSDIYAMGGRPLTALNLVAFPINKLPKAILLEIIQGGRDKIKEAGAVLLGGHSIDDPEPKYGLAVTGLIHPEKVLTNAGSKPGDYLVLTKPLGIGIITTGIKRGVVDPEDEQQAIRVMAALNKEASLIASEVGVNACTDITGFGLLGHLHEMLKASGVRAEISVRNMPVLDAVWSCLEKGTVPGGTYSNLQYLEKHLELYCSEQWKLILGDAQTSGGLLLSVPPAKIDVLLAKFAAGNACSHVIGRVYAGNQGKIAIYDEKIN
jgi:selenide,water dikinase